MIIECPNCSKKFILDDLLLPKKGRILQCGSCKNTWFYKQDTIVDKNTPIKIIEQKNQKLIIQVQLNLKKKRYKILSMIIKKQITLKKKQLEI